MSKRPRRNHTPTFKAKVALTAIKGDRTPAQLAEHWPSWRSNSASAPIRSHHGKLSSRVALPSFFLILAAAIGRRSISFHIQGV
jgi:hypothetical protein